MIDSRMGELGRKIERQIGRAAASAMGGGGPSNGGPGASSLALGGGGGMLSSSITSLGGMPRGGGGMGSGGPTSEPLVLLAMTKVDAVEKLAHEVKADLVVRAGSPIRGWRGLMGWGGGCRGFGERCSQRERRRGRKCSWRVRCFQSVPEGRTGGCLPPRAHHGGLPHGTRPRCWTSSTRAAAPTWSGA